MNIAANVTPLSTNVHYTLIMDNVMYILLLPCFRTLFNLISIPLVVSLYEIVLKEVGVVISTCDARKLSYYMQHTLKVSRDFASN
mgnify:CR=1 FL=1